MLRTDMSRTKDINDDCRSNNLLLQAMHSPLQQLPAYRAAGLLPCANRMMQSVRCTHCAAPHSRVMDLVVAHQQGAAVRIDSHTWRDRAGRQQHCSLKQ